MYRAAPVPTQLPASLKAVYVDGRGMSEIPRQLLSLPRLQVLHLASDGAEQWQLNRNLKALLAMESLKELKLVSYTPETTQRQQWSFEKQLSLAKAAKRMKKSGGVLDFEYWGDL